MSNRGSTREQLDKNTTKISIKITETSPEKADNPYLFSIIFT